MMSDLNEEGIGDKVMYGIKKKIRESAIEAQAQQDGNISFLGKL